MNWRTLALAALAAVAALSGDTAQASAWDYALVYKGDVMGVVAGDAKHGGRYLDNLDLTVDGDLEEAMGWRGANVRLYLLNNSGGRPNDVAQTLQGIDNIEVDRARLRLYELWIEQAFADGRASLRAGLYDLNSEFYATDASSLLLSPPFGIGSEFSSTGPNGPSIFPLTSLAARLWIGGEAGPYLQAAVLDARAGGLNDPDDLQLRMDRGAIVIGEAGVQGRTRFAAGAWTYTKRQDRMDGAEPRSRAYGGYVLAERKIWKSSPDRSLAAFLRAGASDGKTTDFAGGWQAGLLANGVLPGRPTSAASIGLQQAFLSGPARRLARDVGGDPATAESGIEVTISDTFGRVSVQPDLQLIHRPGGDRSRDLALVAGVRFTIAVD